MRMPYSAVWVFIASVVAAPAIAQSPTSRAALEKNKDVVEQFFMLADSGSVDALRKIVSADYIEHASYAVDGRDALLKAVTENVGTNESGVRKEKSEIVRMLAEGDQVWV